MGLKWSIPLSLSFFGMSTMKEALLPLTNLPLSWNFRNTLTKVIFNNMPTCFVEREVKTVGPWALRALTILNSLFNFLFWEALCEDLPCLSSQLRYLEHSVQSHPHSLSSTEVAPELLPYNLLDAPRILYPSLLLFQSRYPILPLSWVNDLVEELTINVSIFQLLDLRLLRQ